MHENHLQPVETRLGCEGFSGLNSPEIPGVAPSRRHRLLHGLDTKLQVFRYQSDHRDDINSMTAVNVPSLRKAVVCGFPLGNYIF